MTARPRDKALSKDRTYPTTVIFRAKNLAFPRAESPLGKYRQLSVYAHSYENDNPSIFAIY